MFTTKVFVSFSRILFFLAALAVTGCSGGGTPTQLQEGYTGTLVLDPATLQLLNSNSQIDFGTILFGSSEDLTVGLVNSSASVVSDLQISIGSGPFQFTGGTFPGTGASCSLPIVAGGNCSLSVTFNPTDLSAATPTVVKVHIQYTLGSSNQSSFFQDYSRTTKTLDLQLVGNFVQAGHLTITPNPLSLGTVIMGGPPGSGAFTVTNDGAGDASSIVISGIALPFSRNPGIESPSCGGTLAAGASCQIGLSFASANEPGPYGATLSVSYSDGVETQNASAGYSATVISGDYPPPSATPTNSPTANPTDSPTATPTPTPTASPTSDPTPSPASLIITPVNTADFGYLSFFEFTSLSFTVTNAGGTQATNMASCFSPGSFEYPFFNYPGGGTCGTKLDAGAQCSLVVDFSPLGLGLLTSSISLSYRSGGQAPTLNASLAIEGHGVLAGGIDLSFNGNGKNQISLPNRNVLLQASVVQPDGKLVVGGYAQSSGGNRQFLLARFLLNGKLDTSFFINGGISTVPGVVVYSFGAGDAEIMSLGIQTISNTTRIVAGGYVTSNSTGKDFAAARFNLSGSVDNGFGSNGLRSVDFSGNDDVARSMVVQSDNKIVLAGSAMASNLDFALVRLTSSGALDTGFGEHAGNSRTGMVTTDFNGYDDQAYSVIQLSSGKLVAGGYAQIGAGASNFALAQYTMSGDLDTSHFGSSGKVTLKVGSIANNGDTARAIVVVPNGQNATDILATGYTFNGTNYDFALVRLKMDGSLDNAFGSNGVVIDPIGSGTDQSFAMVLQANKRIVVAGATFNGVNNDFVVVRYLTDGTRDTSFGGNGLITSDFGASDTALSLVIQNDGFAQKLVLTGVSISGSNSEGDVARYWP